MCVFVCEQQRIFYFKQLELVQLEQQLGPQQGQQLLPVLHLAIL
jgi:hypothetical protein